MKTKTALCVALVALFILALVPVAAAGPAFLCPVVGQGVANAPGRADAVIFPPVGTSFLPGKNMAGMKANWHAYNTQGPGNPDAGPGHNPDFSPIWPPSGD